MNADKFKALTEKAGGKLAEQIGALREKAEHFIAEQVETMKERGEAVDLNDDELRMVKAYQAFKNRSEPGTVFQWTTPPSSEIVIPAEPVLIMDPREVSPGKMCHGPHGYEERIERQKREGYRGYNGNSLRAF